MEKTTIIKVLSIVCVGLIFFIAYEADSLKERFENYLDCSPAMVEFVKPTDEGILTVVTYYCTDSLGYKMELKRI